MKKLFVLVALTALVLAGCSDLGTNPTAPSQQVTQSQSAKSFIPLPPPTDKNLSVERWFFAWGFIDGNQGGEINLEKSYHSRNGEVEVESELEIPEGAFDGQEFIFYFVNDKRGTIDFFPSMDFNIDLNLDLKFEGVNLDDIDNPDDVQFAYVDNDGNIVIADYDELNVDIEEGKLEVKGAKIPHFSRWGFVK